MGWTLPPGIPPTAGLAGRLGRPALHRPRFRPDMDFRGAVKHGGCLAVAALQRRCPLLHQGTVVNPLALARLLKRAVGVALPGLAPALQYLPAVPLPRLHLVQPGTCGFSQGQHDVRVEVPRVVTPRRHRVVQGEVRHHATRRELRTDIALHHLPALIAGQLVRQGDIDLSRQLRVGTVLHPLHRVPQLLAVGQPGRAALGHDDFPVRDPRPLAVILCSALLVIPEFFTCPVGGSRHRIVRPLLRRAVQVLAAFAAPENLRAEMIDRHAPAPSTPVARRRHHRRIQVTS